MTGAALVVALALPSTGVAHDDPQHVPPGPAAPNDPSATPAYGAAPETQTDQQPNSAPASAEPPSSTEPAGAPAATTVERSTGERQTARAQQQRRSKQPATRSSRPQRTRTQVPSRAVERQASRPAVTQRVPAIGAGAEAAAPPSGPARNERPARRERRGDGRGDQSSRPGSAGASGAVTRSAGTAQQRVAPARLPERPRATASGGERPWLLLGLAGLCLLLIGAGCASVLARRRTSAPDATRRDGDEVEAALQEIIAEERAREIARTGTGSVL